MQIAGEQADLDSNDVPSPVKAAEAATAAEAAKAAAQKVKAAEAATAAYAAAEAATAHAANTKKEREGETARRVKAKLALKAALPKAPCILWGNTCFLMFVQ